MSTVHGNGLRLRTKLLIASGAVYVALAIGGAVGFYNMERMVQYAENGRSQLLQARGASGMEQAIAAYEAELGKIRGAHRDTRAVSAVMFILALMTMIGIAYYVDHLVSRPIRRLHGDLKRLSEGDLTVTVATDAYRQDEIAELAGLVNTMAQRLNDNLQHVGETAEQLYRSSQELNSASEKLSASAQSQASSLEETAASMEEMTSTVKHNADNALQVDKLAAESATAASESVNMAASLQRSMDLINKASNKIADIIGVIDEIAFQTNLLALNAAVEAARAGEHGRGFAVVASEVRSLAQRSAQAAKEIKALISDSVEKVGDGTHLVGITSTKLEGIVAKVKSVAELVSEINVSSQEQASGIEQVNRAIVHMDTSTQSTAAQVEELASTSQSLASQADHLRRFVMQFRFSGSARAPMAATLAAKPPTPLPAKAGSTTSPKPAESPKISATTDNKVQPLRPRRAAGSNDDWTEF
ncbi:MAG: methyl-accepting chemotaxis protein [Sulfurifustis sp.]